MPPLSDHLSDLQVMLAVGPGQLLIEGPTGIGKSTVIEKHCRDYVRAGGAVFFLSFKKTPGQKTGNASQFLCDGERLL